MENYLRLFGFKPSKKHVASMFIENIVSYSYMNDLFYLAQWDFAAEKRIKDTDLWCFFAKKDGKQFQEIVSKELILDQDLFRAEICKFIMKNNL
jgi:hypothetical protein